MNLSDLFRKIYATYGKLHKGNHNFLTYCRVRKNCYILLKKPPCKSRAAYAVIYFYQQPTSLWKRAIMQANSARVAVPPGLRVPSVLPLIMPAPFAQSMALIA